MREALPASMAKSPVSRDTSHASTVPTATSARSTPAAVAASSAWRILGAENIGSSDRPVRERTSAAAPGCLSVSSPHQAAVRASCHPSTGPIERPVERSQQTTDSRWFEMETPTRTASGRRAKHSPTAESVALHSWSASCSTMPGREADVDRA